MKYKLLSGTHGRRVGDEWKQFATGDLIELAPEDAAHFQPGRLEAVGDGAAAPLVATGSAANNTVADPERFIAILGQNVTSVREVIDTISDPDELRALVAAETAAGDRKGVVEYAGARITALTGGTDKE